MGIVKFRVTAVRSSLLHGIAQVAGTTGFWPLRKTVHYQVGANCDAIDIDGKRLLVRQAAKTIAIARYKTRSPEGETPSAPRWEDLLQPRNRRGR